MSKALVIKGANFALNKVETITVTEPVPCTGITLSQNTISSTVIGTQVTLTAMLAPTDTTDTVTWLSSDENVATVSGGVVEVVGVGSATITAMCGTQSATCTVTSAHTVVLDTTYTRVNGYGYSGSVDLANNKNWIGVTSASRKAIFYSETDILGGYRAFLGATNTGKYAMPIPQGAGTITVNLPTGATKGSIVVCDTEAKSNATGEDGKCAAALAAKFASNAPVTLDFSSLTTANGYIVDIVAPSETDASTITGTTSVTFI